MAPAGYDASIRFTFRLFEAMFDESSGDEAPLRSRDEAETPMRVPLLEALKPALAASFVAGSIKGVAAIQGMAAPATLSAPSLTTMGPVAEVQGPRFETRSRSEVKGPRSEVRSQGSTVRDSQEVTSAASASAASGERSLLDMGPAERAFCQSNHFWWHELVHSGLRQRIAAYSGIVWKMPEHYEDPLTHCMRVIRRLAGNDCCYYVGITESPIRRWEAHCTKYTTMYLLYVAETSRTTAAFEMAILRRVAFVSLMCENDSFGGESASSASPHYLYVVTRESGLLRGSYRAPKRSRMRANIMDDLQGIYR